MGPLMSFIFSVSLASSVLLIHKYYLSLLVDSLPLTHPPLFPYLKNFNVMVVMWLGNHPSLYLGSVYSLNGRGTGSKTLTQKL